MMKKKIIDRLAELRDWMKGERLDAFVFPSTDAHHGEYVPDHWKGREFISGFNGSAGTAVVTMDDAALWTDSRYFLAAEEQLAGTGFRLMKIKIEGTPSISQWLGRKLSAVNGAQVGVDGMVNSVNDVEQMMAELRAQGGITVRTNIDPLRFVWHDRPGIPADKVNVHPVKYAGESAQSKLGRIRRALAERHVDGMLVSALDDIAWTLNLRGTDVHCTPVFVSYLLVDKQKTTLFINPDKISQLMDEEVRENGLSTAAEYLKTIGVEVAPYETVAEGLKRYEGYNILMDPDETCFSLYQKAAARCVVDRAPSPIPSMKILKNATEIQGYRHCMVRDGVALVKFLMWLKPAVEQGGVTEISADAMLTRLRSEQALFRDISFDTIAGYGPHGAIVHYEATPETDVELHPKSFLLLDSGAQYLDGTTDITRTIPLGPLTDEERHVYTLVLKGNIDIAMCKFPANSSGTQIDILARQAMWREGLNYLHGTGHGVGSYLSVHEGPHQFRMEWKPEPLRSGMTITDEPGLYLSGRFGARTENVLLVKDYTETEFGRFLQFEPLTLCPIDKEPIVRELLTDEESEWLNRYHEMVYEKLSPHLDADEQAWLREACSAL